MKLNVLRFTLALLLAIPFAAKANPVDVNSARQVGAQFVNGSLSLRTTANALNLAATYSIEDGTAAFYVFNMENGYVIVAADDCASPILGYSTTAQFDPSNLPIQLEEYLQGFVNEIQHAFDNNIQGNGQTVQQWAAVRSVGRLSLERNTRSVAPMVTDSWGQGCYYNNHCPQDANGYCNRVLTGCVATSMSEIMRYWGHPAQGFGSHSYVPSGYPRQTVNYGETTYDWANMPNELSASSTTAQVEAVSTLIWHSGVAVNMSYGVEGSAATNTAVLNALICYFGYSTDLHGEYRENYDDNTWLNMIKACLDLERPVHYFGSSTNGGGHAFVCDGYDNNNLLHFNFGWNGTSNDYFAVNAILGNDGYINNNYAIFDIHPDTSGQSYMFLGVGDMGGYSPYLPTSGFYNYGLSEQIYTADEIGMNGIISSIAVYCMGDNSATRQYDLYLTTTDKTVFANGSEWVPFTAANKVFSGTVTFNKDQWTTITLDTPFNYNIGAGNLVLVWDDNTGTSGSSSLCISSYTQNMSKQTIHIKNDNVNYGPTNITSYTGEVTLQKNELRLGITPSGDNTTYYHVSISANPTDGGTVSGSGYYEENSTATLTATPDDGYAFKSWTKNGNIVSTNATYSFTVTQDVTLVANFEAQSNFVYIGDGGSASVDMVPTNSYFDYSLTQQIYTAAEIGTNGNITSVAFKNVGTEQTRTLEIYLKTTDKTVFENTTDWIAVTEADKVFSGSVTFETGHWSTITFDTPFFYNGASNVVLVVNDITGTWASTMDCLAFVVSGYQGIYSSRDNTIYDPTNPSVTGTLLYGGKNQVRFGLEESPSGDELTVYDGTTTNNKVPAYVYYFDDFARSQYVIPASDLDAMAGTDIQYIKWYSNRTATHTTAAQVVVYLKEVGYTTISAFEDTGNCSTVFTGSLQIKADGTCNVFFETPYHYNGGNLLIGCENLTDAGFQSINWLGTTVTGAAVAGSNSTSTSAVTPTVQNFIPKTTFSYSGGGDVTSYEISAFANPAEGGTVIGAGTYEEGQTCALTATANEGYAFNNWVKDDGNVVSNSPTYSFTVTEDATYVANFNLIDDSDYWEVDINAYPNTMSMVAILTINDEEQFRTDLEVGVFCGDECRGTQRPSDEYYDPSFMPHYFMFTTIHGNDNDELTFRVYDHSLNQELELNCLTTATFVTNETLGDPGEPFVIAFSSNVEITQTSEFANGWNWWSSYVEADDLMAQLKTGLGADGKQIKSQTKFTMNYGSMWMGQLNSIENDQTYMIQANAACSVDVTGFAVNPADYPITLNTGWKWIGFPSAETLTVTEALAGLTPTAGDQIKAQNSFSTYYNNIGWMGTLKNLTPGKGYMFKLNGASQTLVFPTASRATVVEENITADGNHWVPDIYAYPSNMTVMAVVELDDVELASENYELAAFANGEVRGSTRLMYVEGLNRYMAFLTIAGDEATDLYFGLYDAETGMVEMQDFASLQYETDAIVGSPDAPFVIRFRGNTGLDEWANQIQVFPNPVERGQNICLSLSDEGKVQVEIVNVLGEVETRRATSLQTMTLMAPETPGVYTLRITVEGKGTYCRKLVVK